MGERWQISIIRLMPPSPWLTRSFFVIWGLRR
nr:MAG TPA: hypothetical protein [Caudoviricetes sp.]DAW36419.1 MAG TPA: hypothetical protein [Caudoviricetes sp.]